MRAGQLLEGRVWSRRQPVFAQRHRERHLSGVQGCHGFGEIIQP